MLQKTISSFAVLSLLAAQCPAQDVPQVEKPQGPLLIRSYKPASISPVNLRNSDHLHSLIRAGQLYLTVQDAIALAIENNLDLEVDRYGPFNAEWALERAQGGGPLRGVTNGARWSIKPPAARVYSAAKSRLALPPLTPEGEAEAAAPQFRRSAPSRKIWTRFFKTPPASPTPPSPQPRTMVSETPALVSTATCDRFLCAAGISERRLCPGDC